MGRIVLFYITSTTRIMFKYFEITKKRAFSSNEKTKYVITGAQGFLGSWIIKRLLLQKNVEIVGLDVMSRPTIIKQICTKKELEKIDIVPVNITNFDNLLEFFKNYKPNYVIHLAGAQVPTCKEKPAFGALINVVGTANVFEASRLQNTVKTIVYASSAAVCGSSEDYINTEVKDNDFHKPRTLYGIYKQSTEGIAKIFWQDHKISSVGIRPLVCYGVGREFGISSDPTKAIKSAIMGRKMNIGFKGPTVFNFAQDIADIFIQASVAVENIPNAYACNLSHCSSTVEDFVEYIYDLMPKSKDYISIDSQAQKLPFPIKFSQDNLDLLLSNEIPKTDLKRGIEETIELYKQLKLESSLM